MAFLTKDYQSLLELETERNITRAALKLGIQQPGLSKILSQLEQSLGHKLFLRRRDGLLPTPFCVQLVKDLREVEDQWQSRFKALLERQDEVAGKFVIGCHPVVASTYLTDFLCEQAIKYPDLKIELEFKSSTAVTEDVVRGKIQFGLVANSIVHPDLIAKSIYKEGAHLFFNSQESKAPTSGVVFYNPDMLQIHKTVKQLKSYRLIPIRDYSVILELVLNRKDVGAVLPETYARAHRQLIRASKAFFTTDITLIYRADLPKTAVVKLLSERLRKIQPKR